MLLWVATARAQEPFPVPPELQRDVDFWVAIFAHYNSDQGVLHDNRNLSIVYEQIDLPAKLDRRERQRQVTRHRKKIQAVLKSLASGKRDNLGTEEARVLALWPAGVSNETLSAASKRIRYQQGLRDRFEQGLIRAGRWRAYIEKEFRDFGVPIELSALPHVESSYNPQARSHIGASGIWQFTRSTGRRFMRIDHVLDERNDPFAAARAAGKLLAYNYSITGNWPMAITAYNHGLGGVRRAMRKYGDTAYADIMRKYNGRTFGFASRNFYVAFLAAKHIDANTEQFFPGIKIDSPTDYAVIDMKSYIRVRDLASALGVTSGQLAAHNLALQPTVWQGSKHVPKGFEIRLPSSLLNAPIADLFSGIPAASWQAAQLPDLFHTVARGDTLSQIARAYKTRVSTLVTLNSLGSSHRIRAGQRLRLPAAGPAPVVTRVAAIQSNVVSNDAGASSNALAGDRERTEESAPGMIIADLAASLLGTIQSALLSDPSDYSVAADMSIEVHALETLGHYADWLEIRTQRLRDVNRFAFRTPVQVGQRIRLAVSAVDVKTFEDRRIAYHRAKQDEFFRKHRITGVTEHVISAGESIWLLSLYDYNVPVWLFRQYNPELDLHSVQPGKTVRFPELTTGDTF